MVARWRHGAFRVVGLEFRHGTPRIDPARLAPHLAQFKYLEFVKMPHSTAGEAAHWKERLPDKYAVLHCPTEG